MRQGGCLRTLVPDGNAGLTVSGAAAGMLKHPCPGTAALLPPLLPTARVLLFGPNSTPIFLREQIYEQCFPPYPLPPPFSGFPAAAVTACTEMQVIRLTPVSFAW